MKKLLLTTFLIMSSFMVLPAHAITGQGTIVEVVDCMVGSSNPGWRDMMLFKLSDGQWFGAYIEYYSSSHTSIDLNFRGSMLQMAFAADYQVVVNASQAGGNYCGIDIDAIFYTGVGDSIKIIK